MNDILEILNKARIPWVAEVRALFIATEDKAAVELLLPYHPLELEGDRYQLKHDIIQAVEEVAETPKPPKATKSHSKPHLS